MKEAPEHPPHGPKAFASLEDPEAVQAQAAILLAVGAQLRGDRAALQARSASAAQPADMLSRDDLEEFPIPRLVPPGAFPRAPRWRCVSARVRSRWPRWRRTSTRRKRRPRPPRSRMRRWIIRT